MWWSTLKVQNRKAITDATQLAAALRKRFQPITADLVAREQLRALRQGNRGINDYIAEFQRLHAQVPDTSEQDALFTFRSGLNANIAKELLVQRVKTLQEAIDLAASVGGLLQGTPPTMGGGRSSVHQLDGSDGASLDERIQNAVINALQSQRTQQRPWTRPGADTTHPERRGFVGGRGNTRGRFGGSRGARSGRGGQSFTVPGVPPMVVEQRRAAGQCFRCGNGEHRSHECPNAISASTN